MSDLVTYRIEALPDGRGVFPHVLWFAAPASERRKKAVADASVFRFSVVRIRPSRVGVE